MPQETWDLPAPFWRGMRDQNCLCHHFMFGEACCSQAGLQPSLGHSLLVSCSWMASTPQLCLFFVNHPPTLPARPLQAKVHSLPPPSQRPHRAFARTWIAPSAMCTSGHQTAHCKCTHTTCMQEGGFDSPVYCYSVSAAHGMQSMGADCTVHVHTHHLAVSVRAWEIWWRARNQCERVLWECESMGNQVEGRASVH